MHEFSKENILRVPIEKVRPNVWNPKLRGTDEYKKVVESIQVNGLKAPIIVRESGDEYEIVDGEQRYTACKELGFEEIYIYSLGDISEEKAKSLTIWFEVQTPFDDLELAPIVVELNELGKAIPYDEEEIKDFVNMINFDFADVVDEGGLVNWVIKVTPEQKEHIMKMLMDYMEDNNMDEIAALIELVERGGKCYGV